MGVKCEEGVKYSLCSLTFKIREQFLGNHFQRRQSSYYLIIRVIMGGLEAISAA